MFPINVEHLLSYYLRVEITRRNKKCNQNHAQIKQRTCINAMFLITTLKPNDTQIYPIFIS